MSKEIPLWEPNMSAWRGEHVPKSHIDNYNGDDDVVDDDGDDDVEQYEQDEI